MTLIFAYYLIEFLSRILDPNFFHSGSRVKKAPEPGTGSATKNLIIQSSRKYDLECLSRIQILFHPGSLEWISDPEVKIALDSGSRIRIRLRNAGKM